MKLAFRSEVLSSKYGNGWYGLSDTFTRLDLESWVVSLSFPVCMLLLWMPPNHHFSFPGCSLVRIVSPTTPGSLSLVHGFTHDKSVPYLFSTSQARSQQQNEIGLLQLTITWYKIRHAGGQAHYYSLTGTSKQRHWVKLHWFRSLCFNVPVRE